MLANLVDLVLQRANALAHPPAVELEPRLAGAAGADAATLAGQHAAPAHEPGQQEFILRQLDLDPALMGASVLGEDVKDQGRAIDDATTAKLILERLLHPRRQLVVDHHDVDRVHRGPLFDLFELALAHVVDRIGMRRPLRDLVDRLQPHGAGQISQLAQGSLRVPDRALHLNRHQQSSLLLGRVGGGGTAGALRHSRSRSSRSRASVSR